MHEDETWVPVFWASFIGVIICGILAVMEGVGLGKDTFNLGLALFSVLLCFRYYLQVILNLYGKVFQDIRDHLPPRAWRTVLLLQFLLIFLCALDIHFLDDRPSITLWLVLTQSIIALTHWGIFQIFEDGPAFEQTPTKSRANRQRSLDVMILFGSELFLLVGWLILLAQDDRESSDFFMLFVFSVGVMGLQFLGQYLPALKAHWDQSLKALFFPTAPPPRPAELELRRE